MKSSWPRVDPNPVTGVLTRQPREDGGRDIGVRHLQAKGYQQPAEAGRDEEAFFPRVPGRHMAC